MFGQILSLENILGSHDTWHYLLAFYALLILLSATVLPILPESPKYLSAVKHQEQRAIKGKLDIFILLRLGLTQSQLTFVKIRKMMKMILFC